MIDSKQERTYHTEQELTQYVGNQTITTHQEIQIKFKISRSTVWRHLCNKSAHSINCNKRYLTTTSIVKRRCDSNGVWAHEGITFSMYGSLRETLVHVIDNSEMGVTEAELEQNLHCHPEADLLELVGQGRIQRRRFGHKYVYFSVIGRMYHLQLKKRADHEPKGTIQLSYAEIKEALQSVLGEVNGVVASVLPPELAVKKGRYDPVKVLSDTFTRWFEGIYSDREQARTYSRHTELSPNFNDRGSYPRKSKISEVCKAFGIKGCMHVFGSLTDRILGKLGITRIDVAFDTSHAWKSTEHPWGLKFHAGALLGFGAPIALAFCETGTEHDMMSFPEVFEQVVSYGYPLGKALGDGAYDDAVFYQAVESYDGTPFVRFNCRRSAYKNPPPLGGVLDFFEQKKEAYLEAKQQRAEQTRRRRTRKRRPGRRHKRRKRLPPRCVDVSSPKLRGTILRQHPLVPYGSEEWTETFKGRTIVERLFSVLKCSLGMDKNKALNDKDDAKRFTVCSAFIGLQILALVAIELNIPNHLLRISILR